MSNQRTGGMIAIGVGNIIFGAIFSLFGLLIVLGGGLMAAAGAAEGGEVGSVAAAGGGIMLLVGVAALAINLVLFISGIGILKMASWGRSLSIAYGGLGVIIYGASLIFGEFSLVTVVTLGYSILLIALFFTPSWRAAFSSSAPESISQPPAASESHEQQEAA